VNDASNADSNVWTNGPSAALYGRKSRCLLAAASLGWVLAMATPALAEGADANANITADYGDVIVVTARKRAETIQAVPVAVTALSGAQLTAKNITDIRGFAQATPGLVMVTGPRSSTLFNASLRGQVTQDSSINADSPIGLYVDNIYIARTSGAVTSLFDIEQMQVLRGVQGTLFGRNNTGGAILISSVKPQNEFDAALTVGVANYSGRKLEGMINVPLVDDVLAARVSASYQKRDGWLVNAPTGDRFNSVDTFSVRSQLRFTPTDNWDTVIRYTRTEADNTVNMPIPNGPRGALTPPTAFYATASASLGTDTLRTDDVSLDSTYTFSDALSARLTLAHRKVNLLSKTDGDGYPVTTFDINSLEVQKQDSAELQLNGKAIDGRVNWVIGGFLFGEKGRSNATFPAINLNRDSQGKNTSAAGYAHVDFDMTDQLSFGGGVRYTSDKRRMISSSVSGVNCLNPVSLRDAVGLCQTTGERTYNYWSWDLTANYKPTKDVLLYVRAARGQKAGGFNLTVERVGEGVPFSPEVANDIEVGLKADWLDGALRTNLAAYRTNYTNIQRRRIVPDGMGGTLQRVDNAAEARIKGIEAEVVIKPVPALSLNGTLAYTDADYKRFSLSDLPGAADLSANKFPLVPKYTASLGGTFSQPIAGVGTFALNANWSYQSKVEFITVNVPGLSQGGYGLLNARASLTFDQYGTTISVFGTNLTDRKYNVNATDLPASFGGYDLLYRGAPQLYGVELKWSFGGMRN